MIAITLFVLLQLPPQTPTQAPPPAAAQAPAPPTTTTRNAQDDYTIGIADVVNVKVFGEPDASRENATVDNDGTIDMPYIGRVKLAGRTSREVEGEIRDRLGKDLLVNPSVSVEIIKYRSKSVFVEGQVRSPGEIVLEGNVSLTTALAKAGSLSLDAGSYVIISRAGANGVTEKIKVSRADIESGKAQNIMLKDADTVFVPKAETFFVNGEVRSPGTYTWEEGLTLERALTLAGGLTPRGGRIDIERGGKIIKKATKSVLIQAGDTIRVSPRIF
jgi:polysaccharide export outer membrane protein